ncbi:MAG: hypothetical protein JSS66_04685 [Armatimonadetes bacterium]|nr:hypothetical protein [Armatimonadota bacterium]
MDETSSNLSQEEQLARLSEQVKLQSKAYEVMAEVYEKYSLALARIMDSLRHVSAAVDNSDRDVQERFQDILTHVTVLGSALKHFEDLVRQDQAALLQHLSTVSVVLEQVQQHSLSHDHEVKELLTQLQSDVASAADSTLKIVRQVYLQQRLAADFWKKWRLWFCALLGFVAIMESLIQFNIIHITWGK